MILEKHGKRMRAAVDCRVLIKAPLDDVLGPVNLRAVFGMNSHTLATLKNPRLTAYVFCDT
jgi:hypothetical protein